MICDFRILVTFILILLFLPFPAGFKLSLYPYISNRRANPPKIYGGAKSLEMAAKQGKKGQCGAVSLF